MTDAKPYHHGNLREALLEAAEIQLREKGVAGVGLRAAAKLAGVSHAAPYRHFKDKQALLEALAERGFARLRDAMYAAIAAFPGQPRQQLLRAGEAYVELALANPAMLHLMFGGALGDAPKSAALAETSGQAFQGLLDVIAEGRNAGAYVAREPLELAAALWSLVHGLAMLASTGHLLREDAPTRDPRELTRRLVDMLLDGIGAGQAPS